MPEIRIALDRVDKTFQPGDRMRGVVRILTDEKLSHNGITVVASGRVQPQPSGKEPGVLDRIRAAFPQETLMQSELLLAEPGSVQPGTELSFDIPVLAPPGGTLRETYHGLYVRTLYSVTVTLARGGFRRALGHEVEFFVAMPSSGEVQDPAPLTFELTPDSLSNVTRGAGNVPDFCIRGHFDATQVSLSRPFTGNVMLMHSQLPVASIELQLVRVESLHGGGSAAALSEASEIQNLQVAEGDISRCLELPLHMAFPRHFVCASTRGTAHTVAFEVNLNVRFENGLVVMKNVPIMLIR